MPTTSTTTKSPSCTPCNSNYSPNGNPNYLPETCTDGCIDMLSSNCMDYQGIPIDCLGIEPGDKLNTVIYKIASYICGPNFTSTTSTTTTSTTSTTTTSTSTSSTTTTTTLYIPDTLVVQTLYGGAIPLSLDVKVEGSNIGNPSIESYCNITNHVPSGLSILSVTPQSKNVATVNITNNSVTPISVSVMYSQNNGGTFNTITVFNLTGGQSTGDYYGINIPIDYGANGNNILRFNISSTLTTTTTTTMSACSIPVIAEVIVTEQTTTTTSTTSTTSTTTTSSTTSTTTAAPPEAFNRIQVAVGDPVNGIDAPAMIADVRVEGESMAATVVDGENYPLDHVGVDTGWSISQYHTSLPLVDIEVDIEPLDNPPGISMLVFEYPYLNVVARTIAITNPSSHTLTIPGVAVNHISSDTVAVKLQLVVTPATTTTTSTSTSSTTSTTTTSTTSTTSSTSSTSTTTTTTVAPSSTTTTSTTSTTTTSTTTSTTTTTTLEPLIADLYFGDEDPYTSLALGTDSLTYQDTINVGHLTDPISVEFDEAADDAVFGKYLVIRVPASASEKTLWINGSSLFNSGSIPDGTWRKPSTDSLVYGGYRRYVTRVPFFFDGGDMNITLS